MHDEGRIEGFPKPIGDLQSLFLCGRGTPDEKLDYNERIVQALLSNSLQSVFLIDVSGTLLAVNDTFAHRFGQRPFEMIGRCVYDLLPPRTAESRRAFVDERVRTAQPGRVEDQRDGRWLDSSVYPIVDASGKVCCVLICVDDITDRKQAERALHESEEKYRHLFLNATEGIFQTTPEGRFLSANPALAHILRYDSPEELMERVKDVGKQIILDPRARPGYLSLLEKKGVLKNFECEMRRADGTKIWGSINARVITSENGKVLHYEGTFQDVTERKLALQQLLMQRDLALRLAQTTDFAEGLALVLDAALTVSGMESGGIWIKKEPEGYLKLISSVGLSADLVRKVRRIDINSPVWSLVMLGRTVFMAPDREQTPLSHSQGFIFRGIIPILLKGQIIGSLSLLSRHRSDLGEQPRAILDFLSLELGNIISRMQARKSLEKEVETRRNAEKDLIETNAALKVLLRHRENDRRELEEKMVSNVKQLVLPYVEKLKKSSLDPRHATLVGFIESNLKEILSPFLDSVQHYDLTPRQIEIVSLVKAGRTTKEIAELLSISTAAVEKHRFLIRKRLGLNVGQKKNLRSYLLSLG